MNHNQSWLGVGSIIVLTLFLCALGEPCSAQMRFLTDSPTESDGYNLGSGVHNRTLEMRHLNEARRYRAEGRYELARQSYLLALSITTSTTRLKTIRRELEGLELMLRTMR